MKLAALFFLLLGPAALSQAADAPTATGTWNVHSSIAGNESDAVCKLVQKDAAITGSCSGAEGAHDATGKVDHDTVTWSYGANYNGGAITIVFEGKFQSPTEISGTVSVPEFSASGEFSAALSR
jgi:hypothetical protein